MERCPGRLEARGGRDGQEVLDVSDWWRLRHLLIAGQRWIGRTLRKIRSGTGITKTLSPGLDMPPVKNCKFLKKDETICHLLALIPSNQIKVCDNLEPQGALTHTSAVAAASGKIDSQCLAALLHHAVVGHRTLHADSLPGEISTASRMPTLALLDARWIRRSFWHNPTNYSSPPIYVKGLTSNAGIRIPSLVRPLGCTQITDPLLLEEFAWP